MSISLRQLFQEAQIPEEKQQEYAEQICAVIMSESIRRFEAALPEEQLEPLEGLTDKEKAPEVVMLAKAYLGEEGMIELEQAVREEVIKGFAEKFFGSEKLAS